MGRGGEEGDGEKREMGRRGRGGEGEKERKGVGGMTQKIREIHHPITPSPPLLITP